MKLAVSSLSFTGGAVRLMNALPAEFGLEIFYEWGGDDYWTTFLEQATQNRTGGLSIHAPFGYCDFALTEDEEQLFRFLRAPFALYHRFCATHYVVHTNAALPETASEEERARYRERVAERLERFRRICEREGVTLLVENVLGNTPPLFDEEHYLALFADNPALNAILDTGHAHVAHFDMLRVQKTLGPRLKAYHLHDNAGDADTHSPILTDLCGGIDWRRFAQGALRYTPTATLTFEYGQGFAPQYIRDRDRLYALLDAVKSV